VVYHGLAGHFLLKGVPHVLRVRVIADMEFRIKAAMNRGHLSRGDAIQFIKSIDDKRTRWTKFLYHVDWKDPALYDLVINLDQIGLPGACDIVCDTVSLDEFKTTSEWQKTMGDLTLSTEVRAVIAANVSSKNIADAQIDIKADKGFVTILGIVDSSRDADKIEKIVRSIPGVEDIDSKVQVHTPL
jgi:hypothetical protein